MTSVLLVIGLLVTVAVSIGAWVTRWTTAQSARRLRSLPPVSEQWQAQHRGLREH